MEISDVALKQSATANSIGPAKLCQMVLTIIGVSSPAARFLQGLVGLEGKRV